nr:probable GH family 25 lysozyme 3 isoform X2 [Dermacentor andersoni]
MLGNIVIAVAAVIFITGVQVSDGRFLTSESQSNATQGSTATELQEGASGAQVTGESVEPSETPSRPSEESSTTGEQHERSSGVRTSDETVGTSSEPPSTTTQASGSSADQPEGSSGVQTSDESIGTSSKPPSTTTQASGSSGEQSEGSSGPVSTTVQFKETNPDCNVTDGSVHVYSSCLFTCEGDEAFALNEREPCYLHKILVGLGAH